jgi:prepilin peptidase CpaA
MRIEMTEIIVSLIGVAFVLLTLLAMLSDAWRMEIPNYISITLVIAFAVFAAMTSAVSPVAHLITAIVVFAVATGFFAVGWFGGGDVKFLGATALWAGPGLILPVLMVMSVVGVALSISIALMQLRWAGMPEAADRGEAVYGPQLWARAGACPYGIAIGLGGLLFIARNIFAI